jgi:uncharacterized protein (UPF0248 family)
MPNIRDILNKIKWTKNLEKAEIWYLHRGAPEDMKKITGKEILHIGKSFLQTRTASIPFHRILKIVYEDTIMFKRHASS